MNKILFFVLLGLTGIGVAAFLLSDHSQKESTPAPAAVSSASLPTVVPTPVEWTTYSDSDLRFSFESPIKLEVNKPPPGLLAKTVDMQGQSAGGDFDLRVQAQEFKYELDLSQEIDKQVKILQTMGVALRNLQVSTNPVTLSDAPGLLAEGTAHLPGQTPWEMKLLKIKKGSTLMDLLIQYSPTDEGKASANRVIQSLSFSN